MRYLPAQGGPVDAVCLARADGDVVDATAKEGVRLHGAEDGESGGVKGSWGCGAPWGDIDGER